MLIPVTASAYNKEISNNKIHCLISDPPDWASGYFYGIVGLTDYNGRTQNHMGYTAGYCQDNFKGHFAGLISSDSDRDPELFIAGKITGSLLFGSIRNITTEKHLGIVGIGIRNETHFYFRLMAIIGPTFYIAGKYYPIN
jgi:hypothetical protein